MSTDRPPRCRSYSSSSQNSKNSDSRKQCRSGKSSPVENDSVSILESKIELCEGYYGHCHGTVGQLYNRLGNTCFRQGNFHKAVCAYQQTVAKCTENVVLGAAYSNLGTVYIQWEKLAKAQAALLKSLHHYELSSDAKSLDVAKVHHQIGFLHFSLGNFPASIESMSEALLIRQKHADVLGYGRTLESLGLVHARAENLTKACECHLHALRVLGPLGADVSSVQSNLTDALSGLENDSQSSNLADELCREYPILSKSLADLSAQNEPGKLATACSSMLQSHNPY